MTEQQKAWLDRNPGFRVVSDHTPGGFQWTQVAFLSPEGSTMAQPKKPTDPLVPDGAFKVGVLAPRRF